MNSVILRSPNEWLFNQEFDESEIVNLLDLMRDARRHEAVQLFIRDLVLRRHDLTQKLTVVDPTDVVAIARAQGGISAYNECIHFFDECISHFEAKEEPLEQ